MCLHAPPARAEDELRLLRASVRGAPSAGPTPPHPTPPASRRPRVQVSTVFRLDADTVAMSAALLDRLLAALPVPPEQLQVAALACIFLVSKMHEQRPLRVSQIREWFSVICSTEDLRLAEVNCCSYLRWDLAAFTALNFARSVLQLVPDPALVAALTQLAEKYAAIALVGA